MQHATQSKIPSAPKEPNKLNSHGRFFTTEFAQNAENFLGIPTGSATLILNLCAAVPLCQNDQKLSLQSADLFRVLTPQRDLQLQNFKLPNIKGSNQ